MLIETDNSAERSNWLLSLPFAVADLVLSQTRPISLRRWGVLYNEGDAPGGVYRVVSGVLAVRDQSGSADSIIGHLVGPGTWFGEQSALTRMPRHLTLTALTDVRCAYLSLANIDDIGQAHPELWRGLAALTAMNAAVAVQVARDLLITRPEDRCVAVLRRLAASVGGGQPIPLSQEQLADMCVLSRGAVSRILGRLEAAGQVKRGYRELLWLAD